LCIRTISMWPRSASSEMALLAALSEQFRLAANSSRDRATVDLPKARSASTPKTRAALSERRASSRTEAGHMPCGSRNLAVWGFKFDPPGGSKMTPVLLSTQEGTALHRPEPPPVGGQPVARRLSVARGLGPQLLPVPFAENQRACPAKLRDLPPSRRKRPPALLAYRAFSEFIDQEHTMLPFVVLRLRRPCFEPPALRGMPLTRVLARSPVLVYIWRARI
jgi:hypothetical protein